MTKPEASKIITRPWGSATTSGKKVTAIFFFAQTGNQEYEGFEPPPIDLFTWNGLGIWFPWAQEQEWPEFITDSYCRSVNSRDDCRGRSCVRCGLLLADPSSPMLLPKWLNEREPQRK